MERDIYLVARLLGLDVPDRGEDGEVKVAPGFLLNYHWGSIDGRTTDYLHLSGEFQKKVLLELMNRLSAILNIERRDDLEVTVSEDKSTI